MLNFANLANFELLLYEMLYFERFLKVMNKKKHIIVLFAFFMIFSFSCSKYEDGPKFSLRTKKQRIARSWKVEYSINLQNGIEHSADFNDWVIEFSKEGSFEQKIIYGEQQNSYSGSWKFIGENQLRLNFSNNAGKQTVFYTILRLSKKELWLKDSFEETHYYSD